MPGRQRWSKAETATLVNAWERYRDCADRYERIAALLPGRTVAAVTLRCRGMGLHVKGDSRTTLTLADIDRYLGKPVNAVSQWVCKGSLPVKHNGNRPYQITLDELWAWLEDQRYWHLWEPERLTDAAAAEYFGKLRAGWLHTKEAAQALCVDADTVQAMVHRGRLPGVICERTVWVHQREIEAYKLRNSDDMLARLVELSARVARLERALERHGIAADGYPMRSRYAYQGAER